MRRRDPGFTIVELLVGILAGSVLAVTAGVMIVYGFSTWRRNTASVELQRDGTIAMETIVRRVREASLSDVSMPPGPGGTANRLTFGWRGSTVSFYVSGNDLVHDPGSGGPEKLVDGRLGSFVVSNFNNKGVAIDMVLQDGEARTNYLHGAAMFRN